MRLLLDTHIWFWSLAEKERLSDAVLRELEDSEGEIWLSPISIWELMMLADRGRVALTPDPDSWIRAALRSADFREAALNHEVAIQSRTIDLSHGDPADRFLAATAKVYDLTLVTADDRLLGASGFSTLANR
jgi:PIN domain nuclease of toxin-antitoxin system